MTHAQARSTYPVMLIIWLLAASSACSERPSSGDVPDLSLAPIDSSSTDGGPAVASDAAIDALADAPAACDPGKHYGHIPCEDEIGSSNVAQRSKICNREGTGFDIGDCLLESCATGVPGDNVCLPQFVGRFVHGPVPASGYKLTNGPWIALRPKLLDGERLSGTVTTTETGNEYLDPPVPWRLVVDGVPQSSATIDTTEWPDGTHVLSCQTTKWGRFYFPNADTPGAPAAMPVDVDGAANGSLFGQNRTVPIYRNGAATIVMAQISAVKVPLGAARVSGGR